MKRVIWVLIFGLFLSGCARKTEPAYRVVTGVQVQYQQHGDTLQRTYTKPHSIQSILTYLRILRPFGPTIPTNEEDSVCRITLHYSHGPDSVYLQQGEAYLRRDDGQWQNIDNSRAVLLYPLLLLLPSDA